MTAPETTITSDEFETVQNGEKNIFTGHVVLTRPPYVLRADRMTRSKATGIVNAEGHVRGQWIRLTGERLVAEGQTGRYDPAAQTTDLWQKARLTRWETAVDTAPLVVTATHFKALLDQDVLIVEDNVHISRDDQFWSQSDWARYEQKNQLVRLWGQNRTVVDFTDTQGGGQFPERQGHSVSVAEARAVD